MRVIIITQSDPFYLAESINYLVKNLPKKHKIVAAVVFEVSPFGKRESFYKKVKKTIDVFGWWFFINYSIKFIKNKFNKDKSVFFILRKHSIPIIRLQKSINHQSSLDIIKSYQPDLLVSIAGNQIFKKPLLELAPKGCINLHTALLPKYRGLMPSFWVLKNGEKETGVSVFLVDEGIDSGPIVVQKRIPIPVNMTQAELIKKSKKLGMNVVIEAIELIGSDSVELIPNADKEKSYYSFPTKKDVREFLAKGKKFF